MDHILIDFGEQHKPLIDPDRDGFSGDTEGLRGKWWRGEDTRNGFRIVKSRRRIFRAVISLNPDQAHLTVIFTQVKSQSTRIALSTTIQTASSASTSTVSPTNDSTATTTHRLESLSSAIQQVRISPSHHLGSALLSSTRTLSKTSSCFCRMNWIGLNSPGQLDIRRTAGWMISNRILIFRWTRFTRDLWRETDVD